MKSTAYILDWQTDRYALNDGHAGRWFARNPNINKSGRRLLNALVALMPASCTIVGVKRWHGVRTLMDETGDSERTVQRAARKLENDGYLVVKAEWQKGDDPPDGRKGLQLRNGYTITAKALFEYRTRQTADLEAASGAKPRQIVTPSRPDSDFSSKAIKQPETSSPPVATAAAREEHEGGVVINLERVSEGRSLGDKVSQMVPVIPNLSRFAERYASAPAVTEAEVLENAALIAHHPLLRKTTVCITRTLHTAPLRKAARDWDTKLLGLIEIDRRAGFLAANVIDRFVAAFGASYDLGIFLPHVESLVGQVFRTYEGGWVGSNDSHWGAENEKGVGSLGFGDAQ